MPQIIEHLEAVVGELDPPPILIGHSAGGVFTQILLDRGYGAAGVAINSAPTEGVKVVPLSQIKATFPVLKNPANRHKAVGFTPEQWHYAFTNTFSEEESLALYERYHIPASGAIFWGSALANIHPGHRTTTTSNYDNADRAPLLFISGSEDHLMPPSIQRSNAKHYKAEGTITEVKEYEGTAHLLPAQEGWEEVADYALDWALEHAAHGDSDRVTAVRLTHIGGPTVLIEVAGWRLLTDPTFDPPGETYHFGWGTQLDEGRRAGDRGGRPRPIDAVLLTPRPPRRQPRRRRRALLPSAGVVVTTAAGAGRLGGGARGLAAWETTRARGRRAGRRSRSRPRPAATARRSATRSSATSIGFALRWDGQEHGVLWISGDTVLYDGVREVADRLEVDIALLHLGGVQFPVTGPVRYTMTGDDAVELCRPGPARAPRSRSTTRAGSTSGDGRDGDRARAGRARPRTSARASAGCRSASRSSSWRD